MAKKSSSKSKEQEEPDGNNTPMVFPISEFKKNCLLEKDHIITINGTLLSGLNRCIVAIMYSTEKETNKWITGTVLKSYNETIIVFPKIKDAISYEIHSELVDKNKEDIGGCHGRIYNSDAISPYLKGNFYLLKYPMEKGYYINRLCIPGPLFLSNKNRQFLTEMEDVYFSYYLTIRNEHSGELGDHFPFSQKSFTATPILMESEEYGVFGDLSGGFFLDCDYQDCFLGAPVIVSKIILMECLAIRKEFVVGFIQSSSIEMGFKTIRNIPFVVRIMANDDGNNISLGFE